MDTPKDIVTDLIAKIAKEKQYVDCDADIKEISTHGANITSALFLVTLNAKEKEELKLFAKVAVVGDTTRKTSPISCPFTTEIYFYEEVVKKFELMQEKHSVPEEHRLVFPEVYGINSEYLKETIVMDNLMAKGFKTHAREKTISMEYAATALELLAKFHALSFAYDKEDPKDFDEVLSRFAVDVSKMEFMLAIIKPKMTATALEVASDENKDKLQKYLAAEDGQDRFLQFIRMFHGRETRFLGHGDFKPSNLMHRRVNDKLEMIPVDFQMIRTTSPVADLMYFFFTGADEEFRRQHYHGLLDQYYEQLTLALGRLDVDSNEVYPEKQYRKELEEAKMLGLMLGVVVLPMITVSEENIPDFDSDLAEITDFFVPASELFKERFNGILNNYREWGLL